MGATRRDFLVSAAVVLAGGTLAATLQSCGGQDLTHVQAELGVLLPPAAAEVGKAFLKVRPDEAETAAQALFDALDAAKVDVTDAAALGDGLRELGRADYAAARTVEVKRWVLSITEARLCTLAG
jgi:hypothetical protein